MSPALNIKSTLKTLLRRLSGWIPLFLILIGCSGDIPVVYSKFAEIDEKGMSQNLQYTFNPSPLDTAEIKSKGLDVIILVRYTNKCPSQSIILDVEQYSMTHDTPDTTRINMDLFSGNGTPLGKGNLGIYEIADTLAKNIEIPYGYMVSVSSPLPESSTRGINHIGILLSKSRQDNRFNFSKLFNIK